MHAPFWLLNSQATPSALPPPSHPDTHAPGPAAIEEAVAWSLTELKSGRELYVHCAHGHGRSATLLAAILIADGQAKTADEAVAVMRQARPKVRLNKKQRAALLGWMDFRGKLN
jgi:protein-tyrosine phosphatase